MDLKTKLSELRVRILDLWILGSSLISIGAAAFMIVYCEIGRASCRERV